MLLENLTPEKTKTTTSTIMWLKNLKTVNECAWPWWRLSLRNCKANLLYFESDFGTTDTTDKSFTVFFARGGITNLIVNSKSQPIELDNSTIELHVPSRRKKSLQSYIILWIFISLLDAIWPLMSRCVATQVSVNSQIHVIKTSHFHFYWGPLA